MKAPGLAVVIGGPKGPPAPPESEPELDDISDEEVAAFSELQAALDSGDAHTGALALKNFMKECGY